jgi:hypothetical protein
MAHTFFENVRITPLVQAAGTIVNATVNGTSLGTISVSDYEYHALVYSGTIANTGTVFLYAIGATNLVLGSAILGSLDGNSFVWEVKTDAFNAALAGGTGGTAYAKLGALISVDTGGTWRGGASWFSHQPRTAGTTPSALGWGAVGTTLY